MTQPPQQPDPHGREPYGQFGHQNPPADSFQQPTTQFGPPGYPTGPPGQPPRKRWSTGVIAAVIVGAVLVLGGAGTGIYFLTKGKDQPSSAPSDNGGGVATTTSEKAPTGSGGPTETSPDSGGSTTEKPPESSGGGGVSTENEAAIIDTAKKYATALSAKDEAGAKAVTCDSNPGILFDTGAKIEVTGKPEPSVDGGAYIAVRVSIEGTPAIDDFPLSVNRKGDGWCVM